MIRQQSKVIELGVLVGLTSVAAIAAAQVSPATPAPPPLGSLNDDEFRLPLSPAEADNIDRLIPLLGAPDFKQREAATSSLIEIGAPAFAKLRATFQETEELEMRLRIEDVVRTAYLNRYVFDRNGFLGISLAPYEPKNPKAPRRPDIEAGVEITQVILNTGASRAGLRAQDVIVAMNGVPVTGTGREATDRFSDSIRQNPPGTKVRLTVVREMNTLTIDAVIGRCAEDNVRRVRFAGLYDQVAERFETWWFKYFRGPAKADEEP